MSMTERRGDESGSAFITRCMSDSDMKKRFPNRKDRLFICLKLAEG